MKSVSFSFDGLDILGVSDEGVYVRGSFYDDEKDFEDAIVCISSVLLKEALDGWIKEKKDICDSYGHFCGAMGSVVSTKYEEMPSRNLIWYDRLNPEGVYRLTSV